MRKILIIIACVISGSLLAQKTDTKYVGVLGAYLKNSSSFLKDNNLTSAQMRKMIMDTFVDKQSDANFAKALNKYFPTKYESGLMTMLCPYFQDELTVQQLDSLAGYNTSESLKQTEAGIAKCDDATYRDQMVDEALAQIAAKKGKKKIKKNMKKFASDCTEEYRAALSSFAEVANRADVTEDWVNAVYHTVSLDDLKAYTAYLCSYALAANKKVEAAVKEDIYNIQGDCIGDFQTWTYKAYPTLFTKKQVQPRKRKGRKGKNSRTNQNSDAIIDGGILR